MPDGAHHPRRPAAGVTATPVAVDPLDALRHAAATLAADGDPEDAAVAGFLIAYVAGKADDAVEYLSGASAERGRSARDWARLRDRDQELHALANSMSIGRLHARADHFFKHNWPKDRFEAGNPYPPNTVEYRLFKIFTLWPQPITERRLRQILKRHL